MPDTRPDTIGRFRVLRAIGEGGMGRVFQAHDPAIDRDVAIKLMRVDAEGEGLRLRFEREARSIGRLHHPNIVSIFEYGEHRGDPFIVMEYVEGETLARLLGRDEISLHRWLVLMDALCAGIQCAHVAGIIHRDIKPANAIVGRDGVLKILDFGLARGQTLESHSGATKTGTVIGTLNYMSPEQLSGQGADRRTDIFAIGAVLYEVVAGARAFPGETPGVVVHQIMYGQPTPLSSVRPGVDADLVTCVNRCLQKDPDRRYQDMASLRHDLAQITWRHERLRQADTRPHDVQQLASAHRRPGPLFGADAADVDVDEAIDESLVERSPRWAFLRDVRLLASLGVFALLVSVVTVWSLVHGDDRPATVDPVASSVVPASPRPAAPAAAAATDHTTRGASAVPAPTRPAPSTRSERIAADVAAGRQSLDQHQYAAALSKADHALALDPHHDDALALRATARAALDLLVKPWLQQAEDAWNNATSYCEYDAGLIAAGRVVEADPTNKAGPLLRDKLTKARNTIGAQMPALPKCTGGRPRRRQT